MQPSRLSILTLGTLLVLCAACAAPPESAADRRAQIETMYDEYRREFPGIRAMDARELMSSRKSDPANLVLVDVRTSEERAVSVITGAIPKDEFEAHESDYSDKKIVAYCTIGYRSGLYVRELQARGIDAYNLKGSVLDWAHEGGEFVDPEGQATNRVHVYGKSWNLLPDEYEAVW